MQSTAALVSLEWVDQATMTALVEAGGFMVVEADTDRAVLLGPIFVHLLANT
jgi:hypothetical protein